MSNNLFVHDDSKSSLVELTFEDHKELAELQNAGLDVAGVNLHKKTVQIFADAEDIAALSTKWQGRFIGEKGLHTFATIDPGYHTPEEVDAAVHAYAQQYPNLITVSSVGTSLQNRTIWGVKITSRVGNTPKPRIFFNSLHVLLNPGMYHVKYCVGNAVEEEDVMVGTTLRMANITL